MKIIISGSGSFKSVFEIQVVLFLWPHPYKKAQESLCFPSHACGIPAKPGLLSAQLIKIKVQVEKNPISVKLSLSAAMPFAVSHRVSFAVQLSWKIAMPTGGF